MKLNFSILSLILSITPPAFGHLPVVIWHGMGDNCCNPWSMGYIKKLIESEFKKSGDSHPYVISLEIGSNIAADTENGFFMNSNDQVELVCQKLGNDSVIQRAGGWNGVGFSQGSQFLRGVAQRCPNGIRNLISIGGQHQGVYGIPQCLGENWRICDYVRRLLNYGAYKSWIQNFLVQAQYWHDPLNEKDYQRSSIFLADINNERNINDQYKQNLMKLNKFVMVKFDGDTVVDPKDTEWFQFYEPGQAINILPLNQSKIYREDRLGLKVMNENNKLDFLSVPGNHLQMPLGFFENVIIKKYLI